MENLDECDLNFEKEITLAIANREPWNHIENILSTFTKKLFAKTDLLTSVLIRELKKHHEKELHKVIDSPNVQSNQVNIFEKEDINVPVDENTHENDNYENNFERHDSGNEVENHGIEKDTSNNGFEEGEVMVPNSTIFECKDCDKIFLNDRK